MPGECKKASAHPQKSLLASKIDSKEHTDIKEARMVSPWLNVIKGCGLYDRSSHNSEQI